MSRVLTTTTTTTTTTSSTSVLLIIIIIIKCSSYFVLLPFLFLNYSTTMNRLVSNDGTIHTNCTMCPEGYYCPISLRDQEDSSLLTSTIISRPPIPCGSASKYCPMNSTKPNSVDQGYYSIGAGDGGCPMTRTNQRIAPEGYYANSGELFKCPPGTFGNETGLSTWECSGPCRGGFYCPAGSISEKEIPCGRYQYCPMSSGYPIFVQPGFYTTISTTIVTSSNQDEFEIIQPFTHQEHAYECEKGYFCHKSVRYKCFAGTFGNRVLETSSNCTRLCDAGYYCPLSSTSPREKVCGSASYYCPTGSKFPQIVEPGYFTTSDNDEPFDRKTKQMKCPKG